MQIILVPSMMGPSPTLESRPRPDREPVAPSNGALDFDLRHFSLVFQA